MTSFSMLKIILVITLCIAFGAAIFIVYQTSLAQKTEANGLTKMGIVHKDEIESSVFVWNNAQYYLISKKARMDKKLPESVTIFSFPEKKEIALFRTPGMRFASVLVDNNTLHIFLTKDWINYGQSTVYLITSKDLTHFTSPVPVVKARTGEGLFNTSVTKNTDTKEYVMALEFDAKGYTTFSIRFLKSKDLRKWEPVADYVFGKDIYAACPKIKYVNGEYYLWHTVTTKNKDKKDIYNIHVAKSKNLKDWITSKQSFLYPTRNEGVNNSDPDLEEFQGKTYVFYADGNQENWGNVRYAKYNGTLSSLVNSLF